MHAGERLGSGCWHHRLHRAAWQLLQLPGKEEGSSRASELRAGTAGTATRLGARSRLWVVGSTQEGDAPSGCW